MRVVFSCRPAFGHVYPLIPLALAARAAGHEVVFATGGTFLPRLRSLGFEAQPVGITIAEAESEARRRHGDDDPLALILTMFGDVLPRHTLADLEPLLDKLRPDLVVYEQSDVGAAAAALRTGVPVISHVIGRSLPASVMEQASERLGWLWDGQVPVDPMLGNACLDVWPPSLRDPVTMALPTRIPLRPVAWNEPGELPAVARTPRVRPLVYLTLGTVAYGAVEVMRAAIDGLSALPVDVLVAVGPGDPAALGAVPATVRVARFVPQAELLPHVDLVVHHGGTGTTLGALAAGRPQLVMPQGADQFVNAELLADQGAGRRLVADEITPAAITEQAQHLLTDADHRDAARAVAAEIGAMPAPDEVVRTLVDFARSAAG
jgi:UDP:flavonoid glycosyltransferase YjiC (YdhE family)